MQRVRQFGDLRQSRSSHKNSLSKSFVSNRVLFTPQTPKQDLDKSSKASSTQSHYICINCINQNLSSQKKRDCRHRETLQRSRYQQLEKSRRNYEDHLRQNQERKKQLEKQKLLAQNKRMIEQHRAEKERQRLARQTEQQKQAERLRQYQKAQQSEIKDRQNKRNEYKEAMVAQIQEKIQARLRQQLQSKYSGQNAQNNYPDGAEIEKIKLEKYRKDLLEQIRANEEKNRQRQIKQFEDEKNTLAETRIAEERAKEILALQNSRKLRFQEEINQLARSKQQKQAAERQKREQQKIQSYVNQQFQQKQTIQNERAMKQKMNRYKSDIQKQIQEKKNQRYRQQQTDRLQKSFASLTLSEIERRLCDSCEKTYPKKYLTKVKN